VPGWRCLVDVETRAALREATDVLELAEVRALLDARRVLDELLSAAVRAAWGAGASRVALARLLGVERTVLYKRMAARS
jgi:hypothetical protein